MRSAFLLRIVGLLCITVLLGACGATGGSSNATSSAQASSTAKINVQLGLAYLQQGNRQRAKQKLLLALQQGPDRSDAWYAMAYYLEKTGEPQEARTYYLRATHLAPKDGAVQNNYGTFLCRQKEYRASIQHFLLAVNDKNYLNTAEAYENAGLCALLIPDKVAAEKYFSKSLLQDPRRPSALIELADISYQQGNYQAAKDYLRRFSAVSMATTRSLRLNARVGEKLRGKAMVTQ